MPVRRPSPPPRVQVGGLSDPLIKPAPLGESGGALGARDRTAPAESPWAEPAGFRDRCRLLCECSGRGLLSPPALEAVGAAASEKRIGHGVDLWVAPLRLASNKGALIGSPGGGKAHIGRGPKMDGRIVQREESEEAVQQRGGRGAGWWEASKEQDGTPGGGALLFC